MHTIVLLLVALGVHFVDACGKTERPYYCKRHLYIQEHRCGGVEEIACTQFTFRCACRNNRFRDKNGKCVTVCGSSDEETPPVSPENVPRRLQNSNDIYRNVRTVLDSTPILHLLQISTDAWIEAICDCITSKYQALVDKKFRHSVSCYYKQTLPNNVNALLKTYELVDFDVQKIGDKIFLLLEPPFKDHLPLDLTNTYEVLSAMPTCFVLKIGEHESGKHLCSLWGLDTGENKEEQKCFDTLDKMCVQGMFHTWEHSHHCFEHDKMAANARQRTN